MIVFSKPYRGCPICRSNLTKLMQKKENGEQWEVYSCENCGSEVWIVPFKGVLKGKR